MTATRSVVWLTAFDPTPNGLSRRHVHFGPRLRAAGFRIHFVVPDWSYDEEGLQKYVDQGIIDSFTRFSTFHAVGWKSALSRMLFHPALRNLCRRHEQRQFTARLLEELNRQNAGILLVNERTHLFALADIRKHARVVMDWCDSLGLAGWREIRHAVRQGDLRHLPRYLYDFAAHLLEESYYPKSADMNVLVSPADLRFLRTVSGVNRVAMLPLGIDHFLDPFASKVPDRLIFSGVMDFAPNVNSALWFIDKVLPRIRERRPGAHVVIAGRNPVAELRRRAGEAVTITGLVPDIPAEVARAQLYVAPMVCGSGFKNKVVEALAAGTAVAGTPLAGEFLNGDLRQHLIIAQGAAPLAKAIAGALENPAALTRSVVRAQQILRRDYSWESCTRVLASCLSPVESRLATVTAHTDPARVPLPSGK